MLCILIYSNPTCISPFVYQADFFQRDYNRFAAEFGDDMLFTAEPVIDMGSDSVSDDGEIR